MEVKLNFAPLVFVLTAVFVVLKLTHTVAWSWVWVLSPLWIPFALGVLITFLIAILVGLGDR